MNPDTKRLVADAEAAESRRLAQRDLRAFENHGGFIAIEQLALRLLAALDTREGLIKQLAALRNVAVLNKNDPDDRQWRIELQRQLDFSRELLSTLRGES